MPTTKSTTKLEIGRGSKAESKSPNINFLTPRLQSFDDTFILLGPRSTDGGGAGNKKRLVEVPQYSQIGNTVPPLMAKAIAEVLLSALSSEQKTRYVFSHTRPIADQPYTTLGENHNDISRPIDQEIF